MKIARFTTDDGPHLGFVAGSEVVDLTAADCRVRDVRDLWALDRDRCAQLAAAAPRTSLAAAELLAPIPRPSKFLAIGLNSKSHRKDVNLRWLLREPSIIAMGLGYVIAHPRSRLPFLFAKATTSITGPYASIWLPRAGGRADWEGELAVVVGRRLRHASPQQARAAIGGYTVTNDVSMRNVQRDNPTGALLAKGYDTHGPIGPWIVPPDTVSLETMQLRTYLNGELVQRGAIAEMTLSPAEILSMLSQYCTLEAGDIVACGTFAGTGWPRNRFLAAGDVVRVEIDQIGAIENPVIAEPDG